MQELDPEYNSDDFRAISAQRNSCNQDTINGDES
jgi:hypothetical protein